MRMGLEMASLHKVQSELRDGEYQRDDQTGSDDFAVERVGAGLQFIESVFQYFVHVHPDVFLAFAGDLFADIVGLKE